MSASSGTVLMATAVVASPIGVLLYQDLISLDDALVRIGICLAVCWVALSVVSALVSSGPPRVPARVEPPADEPVDEAPSDVR